jgi:hypothetical protein
MFTLENDGSVMVNQTILFTSNKTINGSMVENESIDGTLIGEPELIADSSIEHSEALWKSEEDVTTFIIIVNATFEPSKFKAVKLNYYLSGLLERENDGSWLFNRVFNMAADALAPPEIVVKVPKPSQFQDLRFLEIIPTPSVSLDETGYYVMSWTSSAVTFGNVTETLVRLRYSSSFSGLKVLLFFTPTLIGIIMGFILARLWDYRKKIQDRLARGRDTDKSGKLETVRT